MTVLATSPREREDVAVGEVDQLQDAVDERVAQRDERRRSCPFVRPISPMLMNSRRRLDEVDDEPEDDEGDEHRPIRSVTFAPRSFARMPPIAG